MRIRVRVRQVVQRHRLHVPSVPRPAAALVRVRAGVRVGVGVWVGVWVGVGVRVRVRVRVS